jgi:hypothetical protein
MASDGLFLELRTALGEARSSSEPVCRENLRLREGERLHLINLRVIPVKPAKEGQPPVLVLFEDAEPPKGIGNRYQ